MGESPVSHQLDDLEAYRTAKCHELQSQNAEKNTRACAHRGAVHETRTSFWPRFMRINGCSSQAARGSAFWTTWAAISIRSLLFERLPKNLKLRAIGCKIEYGGRFEVCNLEGNKGTGHEQTFAWKDGRECSGTSQHKWNALEDEQVAKSEEIRSLDSPGILLPVGLWFKLKKRNFAILAPQYSPNPHWKSTELKEQMLTSNRNTSLSLT